MAAHAGERARAGGVLRRASRSCAAPPACRTTCSRSPARSSARSCTGSTTSGSRRRRSTATARSRATVRERAGLLPARRARSSSAIRRPALQRPARRPRATTCSPPAGWTTPSASGCSSRRWRTSSATSSCGSRAPGPDEARLRELAAGDARITLLGRVSERRARASSTRGARAVAFVPYLEDYGLRHARGDAGRQAGDHRARDSGGTTELVARRRQRAGRRARRPRRSARAIDRAVGRPRGALHADGRARRCERGRGVTWDAVRRGAAGVSARKLVVATSFARAPAARRRAGARRRALRRARPARRRGRDRRARRPHGARAARSTSRPGVREMRVPRTPEHDAADWQLNQQVGVPVGDLGLALHHELTPAYGEALAAAARGATAVVACHPYALPGARAAGRPAADLRGAGRRGRPQGGDVRGDAGGPGVRRARCASWRRACCAAADHVLVCAARDGVRLGELLRRRAASASLEVPNGADPARDRRSPSLARAARARATRSGSHDQLTALFVGSWHEPNLVAIRDLLRRRRRARRACAFVDRRQRRARVRRRARCPANVDLCGVVDDAFLRSVLGARRRRAEPDALRLGHEPEDARLRARRRAARLVGLRRARARPRARPRTTSPREPTSCRPSLARAARRAVRETSTRACARAREHVETRFSWERDRRRLARASGAAEPCSAPWRCPPDARRRRRARKRRRRGARAGADARAPPARTGR